VAPLRADVLDALGGLSHAAAVAGGAR
jgi:hypothetical protein